MFPLVPRKRAESARTGLAAIESRWIDGASDPRTPSMRRRTFMYRHNESANRRMTNLVEQQ